MIKQTILIALRKFRGSLLINGLNFIGLTFGFAIFMVLGLFYLQETNYERGFSQSDNIFRVNTSFIDAKKMASSSSNLLYSFYNAPEVSAITHVRALPSDVLRVDDKEVYPERVLRIDSSFFKVFDFSLSSGYPSSEELPENVVLFSEEFVLSHFGDMDIIGNEVEYAKEKLLVLDVVKSQQKGTHLSFDVLIVKPIQEYKQSLWLSLRRKTFTYLRTSKEVSLKKLNDRLSDITKERVFPAMASLLPFRDGYTVEDWIASASSVQYFVQAVEDIHLDEPLVGDDRQYLSRSVVYSFGIVALLILLVSCLNFIHFNTAKATLRMKEVGVKRTFGSSRRILVLQFLIESFIWSFLATLFAVGIAELILHLISKSYSDAFFIGLLDVPRFLFALVAFMLSLGVVSGIYSALYLTRNKLFKSLRSPTYFGEKTNSGHSVFKRSIVILQFALASIQVIACVFMVRQANLMKEVDLGFETENELAINVSALTLSERKQFQQRLNDLGGLLNITSISELPGDIEEHLSVTVESSDGFNVNLKSIRVNGPLVSSLEVDMIEGVSLIEVEKARVALLNKRAAELLGDEGEIGKTVQGFEIIGIVSDFYYSSLRNGIEPIIFTKSESPEQSLIIKTQNGLDGVRSIWGEMTAAPFEYSWLSERFKELQNKEIQIVNLFTGFTVFAVLISVLGSFSLGLFIFEQREKEFGIRKVLGASPTQLIKMFSLGTASLVFIGFTIGCPLAIYGLRHWLSNFTDVVPINLSGVMVAAIFIFGAAFLAILIQSLQAVKINPVETLRNE